MKKCLSCTELNPDSQAFCIRCGSSDFEPRVKVVCPKCQSEMDAVFDHCISCGAALKNSKQEIGKPAVKQEGEFCCPNCNAGIPVQSVFCPVCGSSVSNVNTLRTIKKSICPSCSRPNDITTKFCSYCFYDLSKAETEEFSVVMKPKQCGSMTLMQCVLVGSGGKEGQVVCPNCQALNNECEDYCYKCAQNLRMEIPKKYCAACGAENSRDAGFCMSCQFSFEGRMPAADANSWQCNCGFYNEGDAAFCIACGKRYNPKILPARIKT